MSDIKGLIKNLYLDTENYQIVDGATGERFEVLSEEDWIIALKIIGGFKDDVLKERTKE